MKLFFTIINSMIYMKFVVFAIMLIFTCTSVAGLDLVTNGKASGEFIVPENAHKAELWAVTDIRHWIHAITGVNVPILTKSSSAKNTKVFVGKKFAGDWKKDIAVLKGSDGFAIRKKGNNVYVFGDRPRGTLYGVYAFLEENSDLIFSRPNRRFGTVFSKSNNFKLTNCDILNKPVFPIRSMGGHFRGMNDAGSNWYIRNRLNHMYTSKYAHLDMVVSLQDCPYWWLRAEKYFESDPEIFVYSATLDKRISNGICYTNPKLEDIYFKGLMKHVEIREKYMGQKINYINSHMGDSWNCCECEKCLAPIKLANGSLLKIKDPSSYKDKVFRSTQYYMFYSRIMERLKKVRPDIKLCVLAYIYSTPPPEVKPHPDLNIIFAPYPTSNQHFPLADKRQIKEWRKWYLKWLTITKRFGMREYYFLNTIAPVSYTAVKDLRMLMDKQDRDNLIIASEIYDDATNGERHWDLASMQQWIISRLFWDPTQDIEKLRDRYITRTYREAAPHMKEYYNIVRDSWLDPKDKAMVTCHVKNKSVYETLIVKKGLGKRCLKALKDALAVAKHPHSREMIKRKLELLQGHNKRLGKLMVSNIPELAEDGDTFESVQWQKPLPLSQFKRLYLYKQPSLPTEETEIKAGHDGKNLYIRFTANDGNVDKIEAVKPGKNEVFPQGDHIEFWLYRTYNKHHVFAFNSNGVMYDAENLDREWNSGWKLKTRKTGSGWEAILTIPMESLGLKLGETKKWYAMRVLKHKGKPAEKSMFKGGSLHGQRYQCIIEK